MIKNFWPFIVGKKSLYRVYGTKHPVTYLIHVPKQLAGISKQLQFPRTGRKKYWLYFWVQCTQQMCGLTENMLEFTGVDILHSLWILQDLSDRVKHSIWLWESTTGVVKPSPQRVWGGTFWWNIQRSLSNTQKKCSFWVSCYFNYCKQKPDNFYSGGWTRK